MEQQTGSYLGKENVKAVLSPCLFNLYAEYISEMLGWMKHMIAGRNISNLRYADDTTLMAESEEQLLDERERGE